MKYLIIPDLHGKDVWLNAINSIAHNQVVFLGDYFDYLDTEKEIANFFEILNHKKEQSKTMHLLIGNHELHFLSGIDQKYSGFKAKTFELISPVLEELISKGWLKVRMQLTSEPFVHMQELVQLFVFKTISPLI